MISREQAVYLAIMANRVAVQKARNGHYEWQILTNEILEPVRDEEIAGAETLQ